MAGAKMLCHSYKMPEEDLREPYLVFKTVLVPHFWGF